MERENKMTEEQISEGEKFAPTAAPVDINLDQSDDCWTRAEKTWLMLNGQGAYPPNLAKLFAIYMAADRAAWSAMSQPPANGVAA